MNSSVATARKDSVSVPTGALNPNLNKFLATVTMQRATKRSENDTDDEAVKGNSEESGQDASDGTPQTPGNKKRGLLQAATPMNRKKSEGLPAAAIAAAEAASGEPEPFGDGEQEKSFAKLMIKSSKREKDTSSEPPKTRKQVASPAEQAAAQKKKDKAMRLKFENVDLFEMASDLRNNVSVKDRVYRFKVYRQCFIGRTMAEYLVKSGICENEEEAIYLGNKLIDAGLIFHVCDEHDFKAEFLFYRFHIDELSDVTTNEEFMKNIDEKIELFLQYVTTSDRTYQLKTYKNVFAGNEAVDVLVDKKVCKNRGEAIKLGNYLLDTGLFSHAVDDYDFKDEKLYYRYNERKDGSSPDESSDDGPVSVWNDSGVKEKRSVISSIIDSVKDRDDERKRKQPLLGFRGTD
mmetsp:Transcript_8048/g.14300  ORF Transcript_8048/g.14300 Transcript_8048/m.14300 type:complete len:405 (-) Transcript_8048:115-1329(-)|eukprot:CAMPEP_0184704220 /NCGR_PEP_ID=MMETSP0313-20130426/30493_1 /TAXON_ID=2792 /ORGANISM="Porphyridium aerugineum, Strain SAG 1380-2" /LENGTH=404 /DNA_ID=CAMNT_0027165203 /DNA_START=189 /DNA_END=1403 /DNA_ORIENTATION=+